MADDLTAAERKWLRDMQRLLDKCPRRFGFYTIGDTDLAVFDRDKEHLFNTDVDMVFEVRKHDAAIASLEFKTNVYGVCG